VAAEHLKKVGSSLGRTVGQYNDFVGSFERNVLSTGRKFADLNIETGKRDLEDIPEIEALPRYSEEAANRMIENQLNIAAFLAGTLYDEPQDLHSRAGIRCANLDKSTLDSKRERTQVTVSTANKSAACPFKTRAM